MANNNTHKNKNKKKTQKLWSGSCSDSNLPILRSISSSLHPDVGSSGETARTAGQNKGQPHQVYRGNGVSFIHSPAMLSLLRDGVIHLHSSKGLWEACKRLSESVSKRNPLVQTRLEICAELMVWIIFNPRLLVHYTNVQVLDLKLISKFWISLHKWEDWETEYYKVWHVWLFILWHKDILAK